MYLLVWIKSKKLIISNVKKDEEQWELAFTAGRNASCTVSLENRLVIRDKANHNLTIWSNNCVPRYLSNWSENFCPHKNLPMNNRSSFTHSCQKPEASKIPFNRWIDTNCGYIHTMQYYYMIKRNELSNHKTWMNLQCTFLSERSQSDKAVWF